MFGGGGPAYRAHGSECPTQLRPQRRVLPGEPVRTVMARMRAVLDERGEPLRIIGVVQDVSERVAHEDELRRVAVQQAAVANSGSSRSPARRSTSSSARWCCCCTTS